MSIFTLYTNPMSRGNSVLWFLEECNADYEAINVPFGEAMKSAEFLALNPMGKVPILKHGNLVLTESAAINLYIAEQFPDKQFIPAADTTERGEFYRWVCFITQLEYAIYFDKYLGIPSSPEHEKSVGYGTFEQSVTVLRHHLSERDYMICGQFTVLDILVTALLGWAIKHIKVISEDDAVLSAYLNRHASRPAFIKMLELTENANFS